MNIAIGDGVGDSSGSGSVRARMSVLVMLERVCRW